MFIRTRDEALKAVADWLDLPGQRDRIVQATVEVMSCLETAPRTFMTDCMALLMKGGIEELRRRLEEEIVFFRGLDGLLLGMDLDMSEETRARSIGRADRVLASDPALAARIRQRFLLPTNAEEWDPGGALLLARERKARRREGRGLA